MENVHEEKRHGLKIEIVQDNDGPSPAGEGDDGAFLVFYHRSFHVEGPKTKAGYLIARKDEIIAHFNGEKIELAKEYHIFPLSAYIHSGVALCLGSGDHACDPGGWDSSFAGAVLCSKKEWRMRKSAYKYAAGLVKTWNSYLSGEVYGYRVIDMAGDGDGEIASCWGFVGDYESGALAEARSVVDALTNKGTTDHKGQLLMKI